MPVCMVRGCLTTSRNKTDDMILHVFPTEKELVKQWLQQMKQDFGDLELLAERIVKGPRGTFRVCSLHFTRNSYELRGSHTYLKKGALPTVFPESTSQLPTKRRRFLSVGQTSSSAPLTIELGTAHTILSASNVQDRDKK